MSGGLFDNVDDTEDDLFNDPEPVKLDSLMDLEPAKQDDFELDLDPQPFNLDDLGLDKKSKQDFDLDPKPVDLDDMFSPSRSKEPLFDIDDKRNDAELDPLDPLVLDSKLPELHPDEEPLGFLKSSDNDEIDKDEFELIDSRDVPSVEEAEHELELVRKEAERRKREEEMRKQLDDEYSKGRNDDGEEVTDGSIFSRITLGGSSVDPPSNEDDVPTSDQNSKVIADLQQQIARLTSNLEAAQAETSGMKSEINELRQQLDKERAKNEHLEEELKQKDTEIAALKESSTSSTKPPVSKPAPTTRKPSLSATKQSSISSPRTSARLKQETEKKSVSETAKKFSQPDLSKKTSPSAKRSTLGRKTSTEKPTESPKLQGSPTKRKPSTDSSQAGSSSDKKPSSPTKPARANKPKETKSDGSPMISSKPQRNTLDAIKMWEQKATEKQEPASNKRTLTGVKSTPLVPPDTNGVSENENDENVPSTNDDVSAVDPSNDKKTEVDPPANEPTEHKSPLRQGGQTNNTQIRQRKAESMYVSGSKAKRWNQSGDKCQVCKKTVYPLERLQADEKVYHKTCFRCSHCKKVVGLGTYAANKGEIFCKTHFKMLFKMKGNYDEGFGREQHKTKWVKDKDGNNTEELIDE